ncbi:hypothetical protein NT6N_07290 [Oceaniferula spumae]|uniref:Prepilin-type N-terminal cleavage/methylation domain-containing protein n=1 Tax=Oceaniferula spumae TaxID=2979115 RepID=A0AAT9FI92_9BACT
MNCGIGHPRSKQVGGFTLLEMVFVLGMIAVLVTWLTLSVTTVETEERLRRATSEVEVMAKRARNVAIRQQRPYQLTISEGSISIAPQFAQSEVDHFQDETEDGDGDTPRVDFEDVTASEETDETVKYEIKRWRSDVWEVIEDDRKVVLTLDPVGLVEPISIRCSVGKSWLMQELHPLTASVRDEEMSIEKE